MYLPTIPGLRCPYPNIIQSDVTAIENHTIKWLKDFRLLKNEDLIDHYRKQNFAAFIARSFPAGNQEDLCVWCTFNTLLFIVDDLFDNSTVIHTPDDFFAFKRQFMQVLQVQGA